ncbi:MAG TPA: DUF4836 family protein [Bacteroidia bacterium]|nr:DUF4836 family protein [Bacteroidia bacterium]
MTKRVKIIFASGAVLLVCIIGYVLIRIFSHSSDAHLKLIPKDAAAVLKIDIKSLATKADFLKLMQEPAFKKIPASGKASLHQLISDPFATGIDPLENVYGFLAKDGENTVSAIVFKVADEKDLSSFVEGLAIGQAVENESGIYYSVIDATRCIAWNDEAGIILAATGDAKSIAENYLNQGKDESILSSGDYETFSDKSFDIGLFLNNKMLTRMSTAFYDVATLGYADGHGEVLLNFENDKISAVYTNYQATASATNFLKTAGFSPQHFEAIAPQAPLAVLAIAADVNTLFNAMEKEPEMKTDIAELENYLELSDASTRKLFNGDISISFTDFKDISNYDPRIKLSQDKIPLAVPMTYITLGITDNNKMNSVLGKMGMRKINNFYALPGLDMILYAAAKNGHLLITNDYYAADTLSQSGKFSTKLPSAISASNPFLVWADLDQKHFPVAFTDAMKENYNDQAVSFFLDALKPFQSLKMESKGTGSQLDLFVQPGEGNSLYRLLSYFGTLAN